MYKMCIVLKPHFLYFLYCMFIDCLVLYFQVVIFFIDEFIMMYYDNHIKKIF